MLSFKNLSEKQALMYTVIGSVVVCLIPLGILIYLQYITGNGFFGGFFDNPESQKAVQTRLTTELNKVRTELKKEKSLKDELQELEANYDRYKKALPNTEDSEGLYKAIGEVFSQSKLVSRVLMKEVIKPVIRGKKKGPAGPQVNVVLVKCAFDGNYQDIINFIHQCEDVDFDRFVLVHELKLSPAKDPENENNLEYMRGEIAFSSFYYEENAEQGAKK